MRCDVKALHLGHESCLKSLLSVLWKLDCLRKLTAPPSRPRRNSLSSPSIPLEVFPPYEEMLTYFTGKNTSGGDNVSRSLLLDTTFRYDSEKGDVEGIIRPPSPIAANPPDVPPLKAVPHNQVANQIIEDEDSGLGLKNLQEAPSPPPQPTPQHQANPVKDLVSRFRKQTGKEQKTKEVTANAKEPQQKDGKDKTEEKSLKEPLKEIKERSRSPSPGGDTRDKDKENAPQENRDGSWFGGIKGKIVKKIEEKRSRSQSMPVTPKGTFEQRPEEDRLEDDVVEKAEEASPESMAFDQEIVDGNDKSPGLKTVHELISEDDSWEKIDFPVGDESRENIFYRDFNRVKERWLALDSAYIARAFPDIVEEIRTLSLRTSGVLCAVLACLFCVPLPSFMQGFIIASLLCWIYNVICGFLWPPDPPSRRIPDASNAPNTMLLMPRVQEIGFLEGWMNALPAGEPYDVRTHLGSHCNSVHVRLSGTTLRIRTPKDKLPRRAMWNEKHKDINSVVWLGKQWFLKLEGATVRLLPEGLSASRLWNKKYPIAISVPAQGTEEAKEVFLFARTCRDKEHWFRLLKNASELHMKNQGNRTLDAEKEDDLKLAKTKEEDESPSTVRPPVNFLVYMNNLALPQKIPQEAKTPEEKKVFAIQPSCPSMALEYRDGDTQWVNLVVGRILYDFFTQPRWAEAVRAKFQKKLSKIKVPFFMEELTITDIDLGEQIPMIRRTSAAVHCPNTGVWLDVELAYNGSFQVTVNTKLNLMKLKKQGLQDKGIAPGTEQEMQEITLSMDLVHDDEPPSEDDDDDDSNGNQPNDPELEEAQGATSKRILDMVDRISQWSLFQQATETAFIKKKMEEFSNTDLKLTIQLTSLVGRLALNIPPPPTDRLWYGFRNVPRLEFKATPQMGVRELSFKQKLAAVIEKALFQEFQRVLVMPNMDDLQLDLMESDV